MKLFYKQQKQDEEYRDVEFDVEGLDIYCIEYVPSTRETCFTYRTDGEDVEQTIACTAAQHNGFVKRLRSKLRCRQWKSGDPKRDGVYAIQFETQTLPKTEIITVGTFKASGFSFISGKWLVVNICPDSRDAKVEFMFGNVLEYKNL